jgi:hypothetical protein
MARAGAHRVLSEFETSAGEKTRTRSPSAISNDVRIGVIANDARIFDVFREDANIVDVFPKEMKLRDMAPRWTTVALRGPKSTSDSATISDALGRDLKVGDVFEEGTRIGDVFLRGLSEEDLRGRSGVGPEFEKGFELLSHDSSRKERFSSLAKTRNLKSLRFER